MGALDGEAFLAELVQDGAQQGVVPLTGLQDQLGQHGHAAEVRLEGGEVGSGHVSGQADRLAARGLQDPDAPAHLSQPDRLARKGLHVGIREAAQADDEERPAGLLAVPGDLQGQVAAPGDQAQAPRHGGQSSRAGRQMGRLASSARMKSITSSTGALWP